ncbi:MAG: D-aminoacylase [Myxococcales bacterium]|nr:D-aminoacylase [Myxococcales bacterium]
MARPGGDDVRFDLVFRGGRVYDGSGRPPVVADVAVTDDRVVRVGDVPDRGSVEVDAQGLCLAPGFIDVHSHDDFAALLEPALPFKVMQGVTTEIVGNCGMGVAPFEPALALARSFHPGCELAPWAGHRGYLERLDAEPPSANVAVLAGHGTLRSAVLGEDCRRAATDAELTQMMRLLDEALQAGVLGLSTGLIYEPGRDASEAELVELARQLGEGGLYTTHVRSEADALLDAVAEALALGERTGVSVQLSHHKASGRNNWGKVVDSLAMVDAARQRGADVWLDQYPYTASSTSLAAVLASGSLQGHGRMGELRPQDVVLATVEGQPEWEGAPLGELARSWQIGVEDAARRVLAADAHAWVVVHGMCEEDVRRVLQHPATMIGSDGLPTSLGRPHPRLYGTFPRILGHYARDVALLPLERAIHKMTALPAARFGLRGRGKIEPGAFADLVLFDAATILDQATFDAPRRPPAGVRDVYVNGRAVVRGGRHLGTRPGRALRRAA